MFICLWLLRLVLNQRQLVIVVSDWGPYLGSHFRWGFCGVLSMCSCMSALVVDSVTVVWYSLVKCSSGVLQVFFVNKRRMYSNHAAPWSHRYNERDRITHQTRTKQREKEEQRMIEQTAWTWDEILDGKGSWTWEEILAGEDRLPWRQVEMER